MLAGPVSMVTLLNGCQGLRPKTLTHSLLAAGVEDEIGVPSGSSSAVVWRSWDPFCWGFFFFFFGGSAVTNEDKMADSGNDLGSEICGHKVI